MSALLAIFLSLNLASATPSEQRRNEIRLSHQLSHLKTPQAFVHKLVFSIPAAEKVRSIVYGNSEIGYFSSKNFKQKGPKLSVRLIPPTFHKSVRFFAETIGGRRLRLPSEDFHNPLKAPLTPVHVFEPPSFPFVLTDWSVTIPVQAVLNRLGEVVWMRAFPTDSFSAFQILPDGDFLFLTLEAMTRFDWITSFGRVKQSIDFRRQHLPYPNTHTVQYLPKTNEILFITHDCRELPWWHEFIPLFSGPLGWYRLFTLPRRSYKGSKIIRMSLKNFKVHEVWNSFDTFSPDKNPSRAAGFMAFADRFQDARSPADYRFFLQQRDDFTWSNWPGQYCNVDWTHENSVEYLKGRGYLVSVRNLSEILLLDDSGHVKWRMGESPDDDYRFARGGQSFSLQHSVSFMKDGRILVYDNNTPERGFTGIRLGNRLMILNPRRPGPIKPDWVFWLPAAHSDVRGSAQELPDGHIFSYSAGNPGMPEEIFEVDPVQSRTVGHIRIDNYGINKGFEATAFYGFAGDKYLGGSLPLKITPKASAKTDSRTDDPLEFSY